jgi:hypothetical protein
MKTVIIILAAMFLLSGCLTRTVYVPYALPPSLVAPADMVYLEGLDNDALYEYALQCRAELRMCDTRMTIIREMQEMR